ncbi:hypothetical protein BX666DRAFT_2099368 [Dichotomocladium elegans]|nr:hypothetical protein BX666DRAFT_2099368 [Dichotomocladium elegans]
MTLSHFSDNHPQGLLKGEVDRYIIHVRCHGSFVTSCVLTKGIFVTVTNIVGSKSGQVTAAINAVRSGQAHSMSGNTMDLAFLETLVEETVEAFRKLNHIVNNGSYTHDAMMHNTPDE